MHRELVDARKGRWRATWAGHVPRQRSAPGASRHRDASARPLRRLRRIGLAILGLQLLGLGAWSALLYHRFALTWDFAVYHQPWYLIAHGNLDPRTSVESMTFWRNDSEFAMWPLSSLAGKQPGWAQPGWRCWSSARGSGGQRPSISTWNRSPCLSRCCWPATCTVTAAGCGSG